MLLQRLVEWSTFALEVAGITAILLGIVAAAIMWVGDVRRHALSRLELFERFRGRVGRSILLGLEFLVGADIIHTVAVRPTLTHVAVLGGIVLIRTFLSFALDVEIKGRWPWQQQATNGS